MERAGATDADRLADVMEQSRDLCRPFSIFVLQSESGRSLRLPALQANG